MAVLAAVAATGAGAAPALAGTGSYVAPGVREAISHEKQLSGPEVVSQGGSGGSGDASAPAGQELPSLATAFSDTWRNRRGPLVTRFFAEPVNYKADGVWRAINNALVASPLGGFENAANDFSLRLPESLSSAVSLSSAGGTASFSLLGASASLPSVSGDTASYSEALPSTDLTYQSRSSGVREYVTLKSANAPTQLRYSLSLSNGLEPRRQADGSIALVNADGAVLFSIPAPVAYPANASAASGRILPSVLTASGSAWTLTVDTGEAWLRDELASGPVVIDPTVVSASQACTLSAESPTTSKCSSSELRVGYDSTHEENHALLKFNLSSLHDGYTVLSAKLGLYVSAHSTSSAKAVGVYRVTKPWTTSATWDTYDGTHAWSTPGGDYSNLTSGSDASVNPSVGASTGWYYWYPTKMVQEWLNTTYAPESQGYENEGLIVKDQTDSETANLLTIDSPSASSDDPYLEVAYEPSGQGEEPQYTILSTRLTDKSTLGVNVATGNIILKNENLQLPGVAGFGFSDYRMWNGLNVNKQDYGHWLDADDHEIDEYGDGSVAYEDETGSWFEFQKQSNDSFVAPPGIKAVMCIAGSPSPCPTTLPSGIKHELIYDQSQEKIEFNEWNDGFVVEDQYGHKVSQEWTSADSYVYTDPHGHKVEAIVGTGSDPELLEMKDLSGSRKLSFKYKNFGEGEPELESATEADEKTTSYQYSNYTITQITDPDGHVTKLVYNSNRQITEIMRTTNSGHSEGPTTKFTYYKVGEAPSPCTAKQTGTVVKDPDWTKAKEHETLYCSNVLDEIEKTVQYNEKEGKEERLESTAAYNPLGAPMYTTAAAPGSTESGPATSTTYREGGPDVECVVEGAASGESKTGESKCPSRPDSTGLVTSYSYADENSPFSATKVENPEGDGLSSCFSGTSQSESECAKGSGPPGSLGSEKDELPEHNELSFEYNKESGVLNGTVKTSKDADGHVTSYEYDEKGDLKKIIPPGTTPKPIEPTTISVDSDGRPHVITDGAGHVETITYDKDDRITEIEYSGTGTAKTVKFEYDGDGNLVKREDSTGTTKYTVDALNRVTKEEQPSSVTNSYEYDAASNLTAFIDASGTTTYKYNGLNEVESMMPPTASTPLLFTYDGDRHLTSITYPSGAKDVYKLEAATGRPETMTVEDTTGTSVPKLTYTYKDGEKDEDDAALVQTLTESTTGAKTTYTYNKLEQLTKALTEAGEAKNQGLYAFTLDGDGNRLKQVLNTEGDTETGAADTYYHYNEDNELECRQTVEGACSGSTTTELSHYSYDKAGEQTAITPKHDTSGASFTYNAAGEMATLTPSGGSEEKLEYGGTGQDDLVKLGSATFDNSLLGITSETTSAGTSYFGRLPDGQLIDERTPSGIYNPMFDAQGDVIALVNTSAKVERTFRYLPYGIDVKSEGLQTVPYPFGYKGGYLMSAGNTGLGNTSNSLIHYGERFYNATTGRWTQQDPEDRFAVPRQADRFLFAGANPIDSSDPTGLANAEAVAEACVTSGVKSGIVSGGDLGDAATGCALGAGAQFAKEEGCEECAEVIEGVGDVLDAESVLEG